MPRGGRGRGRGRARGTRGRPKMVGAPRGRRASSDSDDETNVNYCFFWPQRPVNCETMGVHSEKLASIERFPVLLCRHHDNLALIESVAFYPEISADEDSSNRYKIALIGEQRMSLTEVTRTSRTSFTGDLLATARTSRWLYDCDWVGFNGEYLIAAAGGPSPLLLKPSNLLYMELPTSPDFREVALCVRAYGSLIFMGHKGGDISIWSLESRSLVGALYAEDPEFEDSNDLSGDINSIDVRTVSGGLVVAAGGSYWSVFMWFIADEALAQLQSGEGDPLEFEHDALVTGDVYSVGGELIHDGVLRTAGDIMSVRFLETRGRLLLVVSSMYNGVTVLDAQKTVSSFLSSDDTPVAPITLFCGLDAPLLTEVTDSNSKRWGFTTECLTSPDGDIEPCDPDSPEWEEAFSESGVPQMLWNRFHTTFSPMPITIATYDSLIALAFADGTVGLWDVGVISDNVERDPSKLGSNEVYSALLISPPDLLRRESGGSCVRSLSFSPDGRVLAGGLENNRVLFWSLDPARR